MTPERVLRSPSTSPATSAPSSGVSGAPAQQHELDVRVEVGGGAQQHRDALLPRDPPDEHHRRPARVDAVALDDVGVRVGGVLLGVDPVVDHVDLAPVDVRVGRQQVARACPRTRRRPRTRPRPPPSRPGRQRVAAAELLGLPRPQRLQRVHGDDVRDVVEQPAQVAGQVGVPGVRVRHLARRRARRPSTGRSRSSAAPGSPRTAGPTGCARRPSSAVLPWQCTVRSTSGASSRARYLTCTPAPPYTSGGYSRVSSATLSRFARDRGRRSLQHLLALAHHGDAASETANPRARSSLLVHADLHAGPGTVTFLSRIASRTTARRPMSAPSSSTDRSTDAQLCTRTPGREHRLADQAPGDDHAVADTMLSIARPPGRRRRARTWPAGCEGMWVRIGHRSL